MEFLILGPLVVRNGDVYARLGPRLRVLLGGLLVAGGKPVSVARLIEHLWGPGESGRDKTLHSNISHLRRALNEVCPGSGNLVVTEPSGYALRLGPGQLDAERFRDLYAAATEALARGEPQRAALQLRAALELWRGAPFEDIAEHPFTVAMAGELTALRAAAVQARIEADLALGRHHEVVDELDQLVAADPLNEPLRHLFAIAVYRSRGADAAATVCRVGLEMLVDRGIEAPALTRLQRQILQRAPELDWRRPQTVFDVPGRVRTFRGRTELLATIGTLLGAAADRISAVALHGLGGVGKTQVAIEYAHQHAERYDIVFWIPSDQPESVATRLAELARQLGVPERGRVADVLVALWDKLRQRGSRWLLVYDDAEAPDVIQPWWPRGGHGHVIVTSRNRAWGGLAAPLEVAVLPRAESVGFVEARLPGRVEPADAAALADQLADLPLALEQACAYMEQAQLSIPTYLELFAQSAADVLRRGDAIAAAEPVATTWNLSLRRVREREPAAEQLLCLCAFLSSSGIARAVVSEHAALLPNPLSEALRDPIHYHELIEIIGRFSLATVTERLIGLHPLVQVVIRAMLDRAAAGWAGAAVRVVDAAYPDEPATEAPDLLHHVLAATQHALQHHTEPDATVSVLHKAARSANRRGDLRQSVTLLERAKAVRARQHGGASEPVAAVLIELGHAHRELGQLVQARDSFEQAAALRRDLFGPEDASIAEPLTGLGTVLFDLDELPAAHDALRTSLAIRDQRPDLDELDLALTLNVFGLVLWKMFDLPAASAALETALRIREQRLGPDHPAVATGLDNLAKVIFDLGDLPGARAMNERALGIREHRLGPDHFHVAVSLNHLGVVLRESGELDAALAAHERARQIFITQLGAEHTHVARSLGGIAAVRLARGERRAARQAYADALAIFEAAYGGDHTETAVCLGELGHVLQQMGQVDLARDALRRAYEVVSRRLPVKHPDHVKIHNRLVALG